MVLCIYLYELLPPLLFVIGTKENVGVEVKILYEPFRTKLSTQGIAAHIKSFTDVREQFGDGKRL